MDGVLQWELLKCSEHLDGKQDQIIVDENIC